MVDPKHPFRNRRYFYEVSECYESTGPVAPIQPPVVTALLQMASLMGRQPITPASRREILTKLSRYP